MEFLSSYIPLFLRAIGVMISLPFSFDMVSTGQRLLFAVGLTVIIGVPPDLAPTPSLWWFLEIAIGFSLALPMALVVAGAAHLGEFFDLGRGETIGSLLDPMSGSQTSSTALLLRSYVWLKLLVLGALPLLVLTLWQSTQVIVPGLSDGRSLVILGEGMMQIATTLLATGFDFALPTAALFLMVEWAVGFLAKVLPNVSLSNESFLVKSVCGFVILLAVDQLAIDQSLLRLAEPSGGLIEAVGQSRALPAVTTAAAP